MVLLCQKKLGAPIKSNYFFAEISEVFEKLLIKCCDVLNVILCIHL
jgi:hypothetical protein